MEPTTAISIGRRPRRPGLVLPVRRDPEGSTGPTPGQARGRGWRRTSRGFYVPADVDGTSPEQRVLEASVLVPTFGGITGWAELCWRGGSWFTGHERDGVTCRPVPVATGHADIRPQPSIWHNQESLGGRELSSYDGVQLTTAVRATCFEMRYARDEREAAVVADMAAYDDLVDVAEITAYVLGHNSWTGIPTARKALPLLHENSWSPQETRVAHVWEVDAGLPRLLRNQPIFDRSGNHVATPDLLDPVAGVVGEYDGHVHLEGSRRRRDLEREHDLRALGLECFSVVAGQLGDRSRLADRMEATRKRARFEAEAPRAWTIDLPRWWVPTFTVEQRRNLSEAERARWLRHRTRAA